MGIKPKLKYRLSLQSAVTLGISSLLVFGLAFFNGGLLFAANNSTLNQAIQNGTLATDIKDASRVTVAAPAVSMGAVNFSFACLTGVDRPSGNLGTNTERVYVDNPGAANNGWTLTMAATGGATTLWQNGGSTENYDFNDAGGGGCTDGGDADSKGGQLTVDPSVSTLTADCGSCGTGNITKGSSAAYDQGTTDSVTLLNAAAASDNYGRWYLTGVDMDQTIPANQPVDNYTLNLTMTVTAS